MQGENDSLKRTNQKLITTVISGSKKGEEVYCFTCGQALGKYIGAALTVENKMSGWARMEVSELNP